MLLATVVETSARIAATSRRTVKTDLLAALLRQARADEIPIVVAYLSGTTPGGKTGIGYRTLQEAGAEPAELATLEVSDVDRRLSAIASLSGRGSAGQRLAALRELFSAATQPEQRFLAALLVGELRQGALEGIMSDAVAKAAGISPERVRRAAMLAGDMAPVARAALEQGDAGLAQFSVQLFRPVQPMLAQPAEDLEEALAEIGDAALEYKMDGARVQVHKSGGDVLVFSRALNDVTAAVPEVVEAARALPVRDIILDGEILSFREDGRPQPFQVTARRFGRKVDLDRMRAELPMRPYWFDVLLLDGEPVMDTPQRERFAALERIAPAEFVIPNLRTADPAAASEFLRGALEQGHEGVMAKAVQAPYAAGARGQSWMKVKQAHTLDLVILAAEWGHGRRRGWLSNLHLGARDIEKGGFAMLGKTFKGLTDQMLEWQTGELLKHELARDAYTVYVEPKIVAEVAFNEIQVSARYASGLALRFARVKRFRPDKTAEQADTFQTVRKLAGLEKG